MQERRHATTEAARALHEAKEALADCHEYVRNAARAMMTSIWAAKEAIRNIESIIDQTVMTHQQRGWNMQATRRKDRHPGKPRGRQAKTDGARAPRATMTPNPRRTP